MSENIRLKDIAEELGVSVVTVSNALSGKKGVSDSMRESITNKAKAMGYDMSKYENENTGLKIGVIVAEHSITVGASFYWVLYQQVVYTASKKQGLTMLETLSTEMQESLSMPEILNEFQMDGLIVIGRLYTEYVNKLIARAKVPVVLLDFIDDDISCDTVLSNSYLGMYKMTRYLLERGHRDIAFVGTIEANDNIRDRFYGYRRALAEWKIPFKSEWKINDREPISNELGIELPKNMPTAFVCNSDLTASILYDRLTEKGYSIPDDISVVGYDNYLYEHHFADTLTTYNVDTRQMARTAVKMLIRKINGSKKRVEKRYISSYIVEKASVKKLN